MTAPPQPTPSMQPQYGVPGNGDLPPMGRQGPATALALVGVTWTLLSVYVVVRWVTDGTQFGPVERIGPDEMESWRVAALALPYPWLATLVAVGGVAMAVAVRRPSSVPRSHVTERLLRFWPWK